MGLDPGLAIVGYGVIEYRAPRFRTLAYGAVTTPAHTPVPDRLELIFNDLSSLIDMYRPDDIAVEELFFNTNITTGISVAEARGVILLAASGEAGGRRLRKGREKAGSAYDKNYTQP